MFRGRSRMESGDCLRIDGEGRGRCGVLAGRGGGLMGSLAR